MLVVYRHKPHTSELGKQQPFGRSESTAANVMERRQALAELEMLPCTFSPALDPHSLALVAAQVSGLLPQLSSLAATLSMDSKMAVLLVLLE